jgi:hypothetical protein
MITDECFMEFCKTNKIDKQIATDFLERKKANNKSVLKTDTSAVMKTASTRERTNEDYSRSKQEGDVIWGIDGNFYFPL